VTAKCTVFWDVTLFSLVEVYWWFGGTYLLYLHGRSLQLACLAYSANTEDGDSASFQNINKPPLDYISHPRR
jgi:hypothetical protein